MTNVALNQEELPTKLGIMFKDREMAEKAAAEVLSANVVSRSQVEVVEPDNTTEVVDEKLSPEDHNVARTLVSTHVWLGIGGVLAGSLLALVLVLFGPVVVSSNPLFTFIVFVFLGGIAGLLIAGLISLRPDQDALIMKTHTASSHGRWTVIVHGHNHEEISNAEALLKKYGGEMTSTL